jgi:ZIP family zinc transporter
MVHLWLTFIPVAAAILGAAYTAWRRPSDAVVSAIQHFAAGVIFAAAAAEILPDIRHSGGLAPLLVGGAAGVAVMMLIMALERRASGAVGLIATVAVDLFIDGLVLGLGYAAGQTQGVLLTIALTIEVLFLGLTISVAFRSGGAWKPIGTTALVVLLMPFGALASTPAHAMPAPVLTGFLAFGLIALLYLVTEELLVEAHEKPDRPWITAMFFVGFLMLVSLAELMGG